MLWFFEREDQSLRLEASYDNTHAEFVVTVRWPDGRGQTERFADLESCRGWLVALDEAIKADAWHSTAEEFVPATWSDEPEDVER